MGNNSNATALTISKEKVMGSQIKTIIMFVCLILGITLVCIAKIKYSLAAQKNPDLMDYDSEQRMILRLGYVCMAVAFFTAAINFK